MSLFFWMCILWAHNTFRTKEWTTVLCKDRRPEISVNNDMIWLHWFAKQQQIVHRSLKNSIEKCNSPSTGKKLLQQGTFYLLIVNKTSLVQPGYFSFSFLLPHGLKKKKRNQKSTDFSRFWRKSLWVHHAIDIDKVHIPSRNIPQEERKSMEQLQVCTYVTSIRTSNTVKYTSTLSTQLHYCIFV